MDETTRTLQQKRGRSAEEVAHLLQELRIHFEEAWVEGYEPLIPSMENDEKDRHVLAAAVLTGAQAIVTFNLRHFPQRSLERWNIIAQHPQDFLIDQFHLEPSLVIAKLQEQATGRNRDLATLLAIHDKAIPQFTALVRTEIARMEDCG